MKCFSLTQQLCRNWPHSTHDLTWCWTPVQWPIIYCNLWNLLIMICLNISKDQKTQPRLHWVLHLLLDIDWHDPDSFLWLSNQIPIRITIIIYNFIYIVRIRSWPNHSFYYDIMRNIYFCVCISTYIFLYESFLLKRIFLVIFSDKYKDRKFCR